MEERSVLSIPVTKNDHFQGPFDAPVTLVEYGDYECPHCGRAYPIVKEVQKKMGARLRFVFRNFPLTNAHPNAELAAESAEAAGSQGKFWEMHDLLYENQETLGGELVQSLAKDLNLNLKKFVDDIETRKFKEHVKKDFMGGVKSGVNGTPGFFIKDVRYDDSWDPDTLSSILEAAAQNQSKMRRTPG